MIKIFNSSDRDLDKIAQAHYEGLKVILNKRIHRKIVPNKIKLFFTNEIYNIITGKPLELIKIEKKFKRLCLSNRINFTKKDIEQIFNYSAFSKKAKAKKIWNAFSLTQNLNINSCPYCNRNRTITHIINGKEIERPQLDHYFSQFKHPLLALSFYNLIPACDKCNTIHKQGKELFIGKNIHPYLESFGDDARFNYITKKNSLTQVKKVILTRYGYKPKKRRKIDGNAKIFKLDEIYQHSDYSLRVTKLIKKHRNYFTPKYKDFLKKRFDVKLRKKEYCDFYETNWDEEKFIDCPESKLTRDILERIGFTIK